MKFPKLSVIHILATVSVIGTCAAGILLYKILLLQSSIGAISVLSGILILLSIIAPNLLLLKRVQRCAFSNNVDELTGLLNRSAFITQCNEVISTANSDTDCYHLLILDLNKFKQINDTVGHDIGDQLLQILADRISSKLHKDDILCRFGGDEFAILINDTRRAEVYKNLALEIGKVANEPIKIENHWLYTGVSIGIATYPESATTFLDMMRCADVAMYSSKKLQKDYVVYNLLTDPNSITELSLIGEFRAAIENEDLILHFQPKKNLSTGEITSVESLVRWQHPIKGLIPPASFIPMAESSGMIRYLTQYVIKEAASAYKELKSAGYDLKVAVNISPNDIVDPAIMTTIIKSIVKEDMPPEKFVLEVTETAFMHDPDAAFKVLVALDSLGIQLSIDDFGTGHSSLLYLKNFPINEVKLDRSFIVDIEHSKEGFSIVKSTIDLAHLLNASIVAEGVETQAIEDLLMSIGCDEVQGFHLARPMPVDTLIEWLDTYKEHNELTS